MSALFAWISRWRGKDRKLSKLDRNVAAPQLPVRCLATYIARDGAAQVFGSIDSRGADEWSRYCRNVPPAAPFELFVHRLGARIAHVEVAPIRGDRRVSVAWSSDPGRRSTAGGAGAGRRLLHGMDRADERLASSRSAGGGRRLDLVHRADGEHARAARSRNRSVQGISPSIPDSGPHGLVADQDGNIWFTANFAGYIGKLDPNTGKITEYRAARRRSRPAHAGVRPEGHPLVHGASGRTRSAGWCRGRAK